MEDLLLHLLPYLDFKTVLNCHQVSQKWSELIDKNKRFWIRELQALKFEKIYFSTHFRFNRGKTIVDVFPDWQEVFEYFEKSVETEKLKDFVCALQAPYEYLRSETDGKRLSEILNPMHIEAMRGRHKLIQILVESPMNFNSQTIPNDDDGDYMGKNTILHIACNNGDTELVKFILSHFKDKKINVDITNCNDCNPFQVACLYGDSIGVQSSKDKIDKSFGLTLSHKEVIKYFLQNSSEFGIDVNAPVLWTGEHPLTLLSSWGIRSEDYSELLQEFLKHKDFVVPDIIVDSDVPESFRKNEHELQPLLVNCLKAKKTLLDCLNKPNPTAKDILKRVAEDLDIDIPFKKIR